MSWSQEIKGLREELASRLNSSETLELIKEKEEQIRELLEEGECSRLLRVQRDMDDHIKILLRDPTRNFLFVKGVFVYSFLSD